VCVHAFEGPVVGEDLVYVEVRVTPTPQHERWGLLGLVVLGELVEARDMAGVVTEQRELRVDVAWSGHALPVELP
jgi:predicted RNA-binding protein